MGFLSGFFSQVSNFLLPSRSESLLENQSRSLGNLPGFLAIVLLLSITPFLHARILYVSTTGDNATAQPDNPNRPFRSLTAGCQELQNGDTLEIGAGIYQITPGYPTIYHPLPDYAPIQLSGLTNITIIGKGDVEIYGEGPGDFMMIELCSNISIQNLTFRGDRPDVILETEQDSLFSMILFRSFNDHVLIDNCRFIGFGDHAISQLYAGKRTHYMTVSNCYFSDGGDGEMEFVLLQDGAAISGIGSNAKIINNRIERCFVGIEIEGAWSYPITNILIEGNVLTDCHDFGIVIFATGTPPHVYRDITIANNTITNLLSSPDVNPYPRSGFGIWLTGGEDLKVIGNTIDTAGYAGGISVMSNFLPARNILVSGNTVKNVRLGGIQVVQYGINSLENAKIEKNSVTGTGDDGILLAGNNIQCHRNTVTDAGWAWTFAGIRATRGDSILITDNSIANLAGSHYSEHGIWIGSGATNVTLSGNTFSLVPPIRDDSGASLILPKILTLTPFRNHSFLTISGKPGVNHFLEFSQDLFAWEVVGSGICSTNGMLEVHYPIEEPDISTNHNGSFFRIRADDSQD